MTKKKVEPVIEQLTQEEAIKLLQAGERVVLLLHELNNGKKFTGAALRLVLKAHLDDTNQGAVLEHCLNQFELKPAIIKKAGFIQNTSAQKDKDLTLTLLFRIKDVEVAAGKSHAEANPHHAFEASGISGLQAGLLLASKTCVVDVGRLLVPLENEDTIRLRQTEPVEPAAAQFMARKALQRIIGVGFMSETSCLVRSPLFVSHTADWEKGCPAEDQAAEDASPDGDTICALEPMYLSLDLGLLKAVASVKDMSGAAGSSGRGKPVGKAQ